MTGFVKCCGEVWESGEYRPRKCARRGTVERDGKTYCTSHDPVAVRNRQDERSAKWRAEDTARARLDRAISEERQAKVEIVDAVMNQNLLPDLCTRLNSASFEVLAAEEDVRAAKKM